MDTKKTVLFICKHNSARSQMAEGLLKELYVDYYDVYSAGSNPGIINPYAVKVMADMDIDISKYLSKSLKEFKGKEFDYVITVCDREGDTCPFFPGAKTYIHKSFPDPSLIEGDEDEKIMCFTQIRNIIEGCIRENFNKVN